MAQRESWQQAKSDVDVFLPQVASIMGRLTFLEPTVFEDQHQNTDLKLLVARGEHGAVRVAVRIRRHTEYPRYGGQFTIRLDRPGGTATEIHKIAGGWGDWFFYGFGDYATGQLAAYVVISLPAFRRRLITNCPPVSFEDVRNHDRSSSFRAYELASFDASVVVKRWVRSGTP